MSSPTLNFSALTPPLWLQQDIARRAPGFPGTQAYFLFSDDLPGIEQHNKGAFPDAIGTARQNKLREIMQNVWPQSLDALGIDPTIALNSLGQLASNGTANTVTASSRLTGQSETTDYVRTAPSHAVIMLPPRAMSVRAFTAAVTNLPVDLCAELPNVIPQRAIAGHEIGHLRQRSDIGLKLTPNGEEARADSGAYADCQRAGNPESGDYLYQWRLLSNFLSDLTTNSTKYWNSLFQYGISDRAHEEYASQLEIKLVGSVRDSAPLPAAVYCRCA